MVRASLTAGQNELITSIGSAPSLGDLAAALGTTSPSLRVSVNLSGKRGNQLKSLRKLPRFRAGEAAQSRRRRRSAETPGLRNQLM